MKSAGWISTGSVVVLVGGSGRLVGRVAFGAVLGLVVGF